jgi:hypothetical protein
MIDCEPRSEKSLADPLRESPAGQVENEFPESVTLAHSSLRSRGKKAVTHCRETTPYGPLSRRRIHRQAHKCGENKDDLTGRSGRSARQRYIGRMVMERAYRNLGYFLLALLPIFVAGFWVPYLSEISAFDPSITPPVHIHAVLLFTWIGLLVFQPIAIRYRAFSAHRLLGRLSYALMALIVPFTLAMIWKEYHEKLSDGQSTTHALQAEFVRQPS